MRNYKLLTILISLSVTSFFTSCDKDEDVMGCTDSSATNFNPSATEDEVLAHMMLVLRQQLITSLMLVMVVRLIV